MVRYITQYRNKGRAVCMMLFAILMLTGCSHVVMKPPERLVPRTGNDYHNAMKDIDVAILYALHVSDIFSNAARQTEDANLGIGSFTVIAAALTAAAGIFDLGDDVLLGAGLGSGTAAGLDAYLNPKQKQELFLEAEKTIQCAIEAATKTTGQANTGNALSALQQEITGIQASSVMLANTDDYLNLFNIGLSTSLSQALSYTPASTNLKDRVAELEARTKSIPMLTLLYEQAMEQVKESQQLTRDAEAITKEAADELKKMPSNLVNTVIRVQQAVAVRYYAINHFVDFNKVAGLIINDDVKKLLEKDKEVSKKTDELKAQAEILGKMAISSAAYLNSSTGNPNLQSLASPQQDHLSVYQNSQFQLLQNSRSTSEVLNLSAQTAGNMAEQAKDEANNATESLHDAVKALQKACPAAT